jgi:hypothetical protein
MVSVFSYIVVVVSSLPNKDYANASTAEYEKNLCLLKIIEALADALSNPFFTSGHSKHD